MAAIVDHLRQAYQILGPDRAEQAALIYTAHSHPQPPWPTRHPMSSNSRPRRLLPDQLLGHQGYTLAYQSQVTGTRGRGCNQTLTTPSDTRTLQGIATLLSPPYRFPL